MRTALELTQALDSAVQQMVEGKIGPEEVKSMAIGADKILKAWVVGMTYATKHGCRPKIDALECFVLR